MRPVCAGVVRALCLNPTARIELTMTEEERLLLV